MARNHDLPRAEHERFVVRELDGETLLYDRTHHTAHCLNDTASAVWLRCDGKTSVEAIAASLHRERGFPNDPELVNLALDDLRTAGLLEGEANAVRGNLAASNAEIVAANAASRRAALKRVAAIGGLVALPVVASILAPAAHAQASGGGAVDCSASACDALTPCPTGCACDVPNNTCAPAIDCSAFSCDDVTTFCPSGCTCDVPSNTCF